MVKKLNKWMENNIKIDSILSKEDQNLLIANLERWEDIIAHEYTNYFILHIPDFKSNVLQTHLEKITENYYLNKVEFKTYPLRNLKMGSFLLNEDIQVLIEYYENEHFFKFSLLKLTNIDWNDEQIKYDISDFFGVSMGMRILIVSSSFFSFNSHLSW